MPREFKPIYRTKVNDVYIRVDKVTGKCIVPNCKDTDCYDIQLEKPEGLSFMGGTLCRRHFEDIFNAYSSYNSIKTELKSCEDCISREQAKVAIRDRFKDLPSRVEINTILNELPSVTSQPKTGHWNRVTQAGHLVWECDKCKWRQRFYTNYCSDCGSKMEESEL